MFKKPHCPVIALEEHYWDEELAKTYSGGEAGRRRQFLGMQQLPEAVVERRSRIWHVKLLQVPFPACVGEAWMRHWPPGGNVAAVRAGQT